MERLLKPSEYAPAAAGRRWEVPATHKDLARKIGDVERQQEEHGHQLAAAYSVVKRRIAPPRKRKRPIGFRTMP